MKKARVVIAILLLLMVVGAWLTLVVDMIQRRQLFNELVSEADKYVSESLFQKAILSYEDSLDIKETPDVRAKWMDAYTEAYSVGDVTKKQFVTAIDDALSKSPKNVSNWETLIQLLLDGREYDNAKHYLDKAKSEGVKSEKLSELREKVYYAFTEKSKVFTSVSMSTSGSFTLYDGKNWGVMNSDGSWKYENEYKYASPVIDGQFCLLSTERDVRIIDKNDITQAIITAKFESAKATSDGIIPLFNSGKWEFYDYDQSVFVLDEYENVSSFIEGKAAVKKSGKWFLIDKTGEKLLDTAFDEIVVLDNGEFSFDDVMIAAVSGKYAMYDLNGKAKNSFTASKMDFYFGDLIAFQDQSGKWGFVNKDGEIVIAPSFSEAKSFSNGLGAVKNSGKWGFVNSDGKLVIDYQFSEANYFSDSGICSVSTTGEGYHFIQLRYFSR